MNPIAAAILISIVALFFGYVLYLVIVVSQLEKGKLGNGRGGVYLVESGNWGMEWFFIPMTKSELQYSEEHSEEWLREAHRLKWRIRWVRVGGLPRYVLEDFGPERLSESIHNVFDDEEGEA